MAPVMCHDHTVVERRSNDLSYLERKADTDTLTVFFHGLGLDATDYLHHLEHHDGHGVALNLRGYEPDGTRGLPPVGLASHIRMAAAFVETLSGENAGKRIILVGFSLGADLVLQLAEHWQGPKAAAPPVTAAVLLDPNVNQSTMTISRIFAEADPRNPVPAFKRLIGLAPDKETFRSLCHYLTKVTPKDFGQLSQLSRDTLSYWEPTGYDQFGTRLNRVAQLADRVRLVLSASYEEHLPAMNTALQRHEGRDRISARITKLDHFELINEETLSYELRSLTG
ncbi:alpha/beta hydrolase [Streptomyces sp. TRM 70361]|uniref:alpha/beta hydrolase n=1 Tax=Streptomyces sp. TRM 70361 TaxID=3116553 RepID=UPI002E7ABF6B|nr:alpha/beta hydrolase [Streptomyces sp. TRM 70361]MEE1938978.1 alpha/beta hydrolase [Streptomyces sp. TRM 70361]